MSMRRPPPLVAILAALLLLVACGDADTEPDAGGEDLLDEEDAEDGPDEGDAAADDLDGAADAEDDPADPTDTNGDHDGEADDAPPDPGGEILGTVVADGTEYGIDEVIRCEPFEDGVVDRELELIGLGRGSDGSRVQIDVYVEELMGAPFDDVSWSGPEGVFGGPEDAEIDQTGDRITGSATLLDPMEGTVSLAISFDLPVPSELTACR